MSRFILGAIALVWLPAFAARPLAAANIRFDESLPQVRFAADDLRAALLERGIDSQDIQFQFELDSSDAPPESFSIRREANRVAIAAPDAAGLMYGGLEVAELIRIRGLDAVQDDEQTPYMQMRGVKFNIPLDARAPSYTDMSDSAQLNLPHMWDFSFWTEYIDTLARYRYNYVSLWNLHPFPSLVETPGYEDVALDDVMRSTLSRRSFPTGNHAEFDELYPTTGHGMDQPKILENVEIIKRLSIHEKIEFWRRVMAYGKSRNIDFYIVTWNIFTYGVEGKYGIDDSIDNPVTIDYFRRSVKQLLLDYPDLKGIGITTGENMHGASTRAKEDWIFATYGQGMLDAAAEQPERRFRFIHREHQASADQIAEIFKPLLDNPNIDFIFSFKYAQAHIYSATEQTFHTNFLQQIGDIKTIWTLRNDDVYYFRWGAPDFVREFIRNIPKEPTQGLYLGSDQYIWGRDFLERDPDFAPSGQRQLEIVKHWYQWMLWGRLSYDPNLGNDRFGEMLAHRFSTRQADTLFDAWQAASTIYPLVTGYHWGRLDFEWYIEGSKSQPGPAQTPSGFHDLNRFISLPPHPRSIAATPEEASRQIDAAADRALAGIEAIDGAPSRELRKTLEDIRIVAYMGKYYAAKIQAAAHLDAFRQSGNLAELAAAQAAAKRSAEYWRLYASTALAHYHNPIWLNRVGMVDWRDTYDDVLHELSALAADTDLPPMQPTPGGHILEAEDAKLVGAAVDSEYGNYTGSGYVRLYSESRPSIEWIYHAPEAGAYVLEFRYATTWWSGFTELPLTINEQGGTTFRYYRTASPKSWAGDRVRVELEKGENIIRLQGNRSIIIDHLNVLEPAF